LIVGSRVVEYCGRFVLNVMLKVLGGMDVETRDGGGHRNIGHRKTREVRHKYCLGLSEEESMNRIRCLFAKTRSKVNQCH
jgi:hypothetical protein